MELHDRIGQPLLALKLMVGSLRGFTHSADMAKELDEIDDLIGGMIDDTRTLTFELCPHVLYMLGFETAIEWLAEKSEKRYGVSFQCESDHKPNPMDEDLKVFLFQAIRELMTNVGKHARATNARVSVSRNNGIVSIEVEDDGIGFDVLEVDSLKEDNMSFGLFSIRESLYHLGGSFQITSKYGEGTSIRLTAPIETAAGAKEREGAHA
jgi:signal transduction histidine kinase